jgi:hypothetical protein
VVRVVKAERDAQPIGVERRQRKALDAREAWIAQRGSAAAWRFSASCLTIRASLGIPCALHRLAHIPHIKCAAVVVPDRDGVLGLVQHGQRRVSVAAVGLFPCRLSELEAGRKCGRSPRRSEGLRRSGASFD